MIAGNGQYKKVDKMNLISKFLMVVALVGLGACTDPAQFGGGDGTGGTGDLGAAGDPASAAYFQQTVGDRVWFEVDQSTLTDAAILTLDAQANWLLQYTEYSAIVEGHADEQGTREYNLALGARRASAVEQYLVSRGVAGNRVRTVSYGKERPIEICSDEACYAQNRRGVTVVSAGNGS
ncbi:peptidoglycan-associated lipoprotein [Actibacterium atlanticum]|uniref:Peptidoglycan-associated protein n=2 Tax=Actibacterium atlanticum TaxID=1461693 RepID=A0A058ZPB7_9RHOB|nr:peptidoglycan-associated lipoprotein [Actibacterium atlanticum]